MKGGGAAHTRKIVAAARSLRRHADSTKASTRCIADPVELLAFGLAATMAAAGADGAEDGPEPDGVHRDSTGPVDDPRGWLPAFGEPGPSSTGCSPEMWPSLSAGDSVEAAGHGLTPIRFEARLWVQSSDVGKNCAVRDGKTAPNVGWLSALLFGVSADRCASPKDLSPYSPNPLDSNRSVSAAEIDRRRTPC